ncbi:MAG TPA: sugar porter family MFS transporter [Verrucomicrobiae bacterium]|nr:sugar porter family MFS transporter [Verrucomicrobiae bacterium]
MKSNYAYLISVSLIVALGGFLLGFDATVISGVGPFIKNYFGLKELQYGWAVSSLGWGALAGNAMAGLLSDRFGRKKVLLLTALLFVVSALMSAAATEFWQFVVSRIIGGIAVGGAILIAPVYIAEIAPPKQRGSLVSFNQLNIVIGISASFFSNYFLLRMGNNAWRWMLGVEAAPALLYFISLFFVPESPRWLLNQGRADEAREIFARVGGVEYAHEELLNIQQSLKGSTRDWRAWRKRGMLYIMVIAFGIAFFQQITGINAIFYYLPTIFAQAGGGQNAAFQQAVLVGLVNLFMTLVAIWLIDRLGRKPLLIIGATGMAVSLLTCAWAFHSANYQLTDKSFELLKNEKLPADLLADLKAGPKEVFTTDKDFLNGLEKHFGADRIEPHRDSLTAAGLNIKAQMVLMAIIGFVASFAISLGPVMWVLLSEIFPNEYRGAAISIVGFWNSIVSSSVTFIFPWELSHFGSAGTFLGYGLLALATLFFVLLFIPETKRKTLEELQTVLLRH